MTGEYWDILTGKRMQAKTSWKTLIADYRTSDRWTTLKPRTRRDYERVLTYIEEKAGARDVKLLTRSDVIAAQKANEHRTRFANYIPQIFVVLCEHAIDLGWLKENPAKGARALKTPDDRKQAHEPWPNWAVDKFRAEASSLARLIFEIGIGSVQRPSDWVALNWRDYDGTNLKTTQGKTDVNLVLPCTDHLKAALDAHKAALAYVPLASKAILSLDNGNRMTYFYMAKVMRAERIRLGLEAYDLHALRYRGVMELAWAGCTDDEIASFSGHATMAMIKKYAGEARQIMLEIKGEAARRLGIKKLDKTFQDLRDTAFTEMKEAGFDKHQIASRTQQSPASIDRLDQKHYGITTTAISDDAADLLDRARSRKSSAHMRDKTA